MSNTPDQHAGSVNPANPFAGSESADLQSVEFVASQTATSRPVNARPATTSVPAAAASAGVSAAATPSPVLAPGQEVGKVRLDKLLGRGGMGEVWLAYHPALDIPVAIKFIHAHLASASPVAIPRFVQEARLAARIDHPNVVRVLDVGYDEARHYIIMQYIDGGSLADLLQAGPIPLADALSALFQAAQALEAAGEHRIVHRDIKPANLMVSRDGRVKLADLGLAKLIAEEQAQSHGLTATGQTVGTVHYMSPEQVQGFALDARSDIYALGATFFHLLTARPPYFGRTPFEVFRQHMDAAVPQLAAVWPAAPQPVQQLLEQVMAKRVDQRVQDAEALVDLVRKTASALEIDVYADGGRLPSLVRRAGKPATALSVVLDSVKDARQVTNRAEPSRWMSASVSIGLLDLARAGDPIAWRKLVRVILPLVQKWCRSAHLPPADADDVTQEVLVVMVSHLDRFRPVGPDGKRNSFRGWVYGITRNTLRNYYRTQQREVPGQGGSAALQSFHQMADVLPESVDSFPGVQDELLASALNQLREQVEPRTWQAFWRTVVDGVSPAAVAEELHLSVNAVYVARSRVLARLRAEFGDLLT